MQNNTSQIESFKKYAMKGETPIASYGTQNRHMIITDKRLVIAEYEKSNKYIKSYKKQSINNINLLAPSKFQMAKLGKIEIVTKTGVEIIEIIGDYEQAYSELMQYVFGS